MLFYETASRQEQITVLLQKDVILFSLYLIAYFFDIVPGVFYLHYMIEWEFFVYHPKAMIGPHVIEAILRQLRCPCSYTAI